MNDSYEEIVNHFNSPTLVLAGPGAGKTYLLADRVKRLLEMGIDKRTITILAFGKDAEQHMYNELTDRKGHFRLDPKSLPHISTMHSLGFEIVNEKLGQFGLCKTTVTVQESEDLKRLMFRDAALVVGLSEKDATEACHCKELGECKENEPKPKCTVCQKYWEIMSKCNRIDFDDQILFACLVLETNHDILVKYQTQCLHLLVDEYQDINAAQFRLIELLSRQYRNGLFVVGDDAQSIYGFRGASPNFILNFKEYFPNATTPPLAHSRRCPSNIMETASQVLVKYYPNWTGPFELKYHTPEGDKPVVWQLPSDLAEAEMVARASNFFINDKKSVLVLAPKKDLFRMISKELRKRRIAHACPISLIPDNIQSRLKTVSIFLNWIQSPKDNFLTRLVIEELINQGSAKIPGSKKDKRCKPETLKLRIQEETKIANLWESVNRRNTLLDIIEHYQNQDNLKRIKDTLTELLYAYNNSDSGKKGDFAKKLVSCHY